VLGSSQKSRWQELTGGGPIVRRVIRRAGDLGIDVHVIARRQLPAGFDQTAEPPEESRRCLPGRVGVGQAEAAGCLAGYPVGARTQEALSLDALAVKYPHTRVSPYEYVASTAAHTNCTHFRPVDCLRPAKALVRTCPRQVSNLRPAA
jgi:hypothetical protein